MYQPWLPTISTPSHIHVLVWTEAREDRRGHNLSGKTLQSQRHGQSMAHTPPTASSCPIQFIAGADEKISFQILAWRLVEMWSTGWPLVWEGNMQNLNFIWTSSEKKYLAHVSKKDRAPLILYNHYLFYLKTQIEEGVKGRGGRGKGKGKNLICFTLELHCHTEKRAPGWDSDTLTQPLQ